MQDILIKLKEENSDIYDYLKKDIEFYLQPNNSTIKKFIYGRINLDKEDIITLKNCIKNKKTLCNTEIIIEIRIYINKIKYKKTLEKNYNSIDEIIKNGSTRNRLKSVNIQKVSDLIEFTEEELNTIEGLGKTSIKIIESALEERNIINLENPILVNEMLKEKNYGIIPNIICEDKKENIKKELKQLYKLRKKLLEQLNKNDEEIKKLEKKLGGKK